MSSVNTMEPPTIGSVWRHIAFDTTIIIVDPRFAKNRTRNIVWKCISTGEISGCNSCEWFYSDWKLASIVSKTTEN